MAGPDCVKPVDMGQHFGLPYSEASTSEVRAVTCPDTVETRLSRAKIGGGQTSSLTKVR